MNGILTKCEREQRQEPVPGRFMPHCLPDGKYKQIQCHGSTGYCWCVDEDGIKVDGTEVKGQDPVCSKREEF